MRNLSKQLLISTAAATMLFGSAITANAAQEDVFDAEYYAETYPDVVAVFGNDENALLQHYLSYGIAEGRSASAYYNALAYKTVNTDLAAAFGDDWDAYADHYIEYGAAEGRYTGGIRAITDEEYAAAVAKIATEAETTVQATSTSDEQSVANSESTSVTSSNLPTFATYTEVKEYAISLGYPIGNATDNGDGTAMNYFINCKQDDTYTTWEHEYSDRLKDLQASRRAAEAILGITNLTNEEVESSNLIAHCVENDYNWYVEICRCW